MAHALTTNAYYELMLTGRSLDFSRHCTLLLLAIALTPAGYCAFAEADSPDHTALIARMREAALTYSDHLQDFICTQITTRSADNSGSGTHWKLLEVQELELSYVGHRENYILRKVNGDSKDVERRVKPGFFRDGVEFGSAWAAVFDPKVNAEFNWEREDTTDAEHLCVFRYHVPLVTSTWVEQADSDRVTFAHNGFVYADCKSGSVMRLQIETEPATVARNWRGKSYNLAIGEQLDVRYQPTVIGTKQFLLPQSAKTINRFGDTLTKAEIQYKDYRKFQADSKIIFDHQEQKPETTSKPRQ